MPPSPVRLLLMVVGGLTALTLLSEWLSPSRPTPASRTAADGMPPENARALGLDRGSP